jgi:hypothetical protein
MLVDISHLYVQSSVSNNVSALHMSSRLGPPIHKSGDKLASFVQNLSYSQQSVDASGVSMTEHCGWRTVLAVKLSFVQRDRPERSCIEEEMRSIRIVACDMQQRHLCQAVSDETGADEGFLA